MPPDEVKNAVVQTSSVKNPAELLWNLIIRPPRSKYKHDQLGPVHFRIGKRAYVRRTDVELHNPRGHALQCSFFEPLPQAAWEESRIALATGQRANQGTSSASGGVSGEGQGPTPCVVFLHGNSSCRLEAIPLITLLLPLNISLFCFDFSGCGLSEGEYISLGWFERDDLAACIDYLRTLGRVSTIALWGRSMGAFTAVLHADRDPTIAGLVLDSPFTTLSTLAQELAGSYAKVPAWMVRGVLPVVRNIIQTKAGFDIEDLDAFNHVSSSFSPALFVAADGDDFIQPHHAKDLYDAYQGEKELCTISGDHNSVRPEACRRKAALFLCRAFHNKQLDRLLEKHAGGLFDIFSGKELPQTQDSSADAGEEGAALCRQMQVFPALRMMLLVRQRCCRRPFAACTVIRLLQDQSEAGFFLRLQPVYACDSLTGGAGSTPHLLVVTVSAQALIISRVCDDSLETVAAADGLAPREAKQLMLCIDRAGALQLQLGEERPLQFDCGTAFREEVSLWLMLLHGQTSFGTLTVDDGEATIRENLGDLVIHEKHLGRIAYGNDPAPLPRGDFGLVLPGFALAPPAPAELLPMPPPPDSVAEVAGASGDARGNAADNIAVMNESVDRPEILVGWRIFVHTLGEGLVVGVQRRWGRSTLHLVVRGTGAGAPAAWHDTPAAVLLCRKGKHTRSRWGCTFELLSKEF